MMATSAPSSWSRALLITVACLAVATSLAFLPVVGLNQPELLDTDPLLPPLSLGMLGITPLLSGAVLVELFSLVLPSWRRRRIAGRAARAPIRRAALVLGLALASLQAYFTWKWAQSALLYSFSPWPSADDSSAFEFFLSLIGATALLALLARTITAHGIGNGFSLLVLLDFLLLLASRTHAAISSALERDLTVSPLMLTVGVVTIVWFVLAMLRRQTPRTAERPPVHIPAPSSSLEPISGAVVVLWAVQYGLDPTTLSFTGYPPPAPGTSSYWTIYVPVAMVLTWAFTALLYRSRALCDVWHRYECHRAGQPVDRTRVELAVARARWSALLWTVPLILGFTLAESYLAGAVLGVSMVAFAVVIAIMRDIETTRRFVTTHGPVVSIDELHRPYLLPIVMEALQDAGIPAHPRGRDHRAMGQFFAPYVPIELLVPATDEQKATEIVALWVGVSSSNESPHD